jgi:hypothetical protein
MAWCDPAAQSELESQLNIKHVEHGALCSEIDRLRASVEDVVVQRATQVRVMMTYILRRRGVQNADSRCYMASTAPQYATPSTPPRPSVRVRVRARAVCVCMCMCMCMHALLLLLLLAVRGAAM